MSAVVERVDRIEEALADFTTSVGIEFNKLYYSQLLTQRGMRQLQDEMREFKDEMRTFKDEVRADQDASRRERIEMNRKWGDLSNKLGTMVEDLVYPSLSRIVQETFGEELRDIVLRFKRRLPLRTASHAASAPEASSAKRYSVLGSMSTAPPLN